MAVMVLYGTDEDRIMLDEQKISAQRAKDGWEVRRVDGRKSDPRDIALAFQQGLFDPDPILVVLRNPARVKGIRQLLEDAPMDALVIQNGKRPRVLDTFPSTPYDLPKAYKRLEASAGFLEEQVRELGKEIDPKVCLALVKRIGMDFGVLRWEALKIAYQTEGEKVDPKGLGRLIAPLSEAQGTDLVEAIAARDIRSFLFQCSRLEQSSSKDPTMGMCAGLLFTSTLKWLEISLRLSKGESAGDIASAVGVSPYLLERVLIPQVRSLGLKRIRGLLALLSECEKAVKSGGINPWVRFKAGILKLIGF